MREQLVSLLVSKVGLDQQKAGQAVDTVLKYLQDNPNQLAGFIDKAGLGGKGGVGGIASKLGGMFKKK